MQEKDSTMENQDSDFANTSSSNQEYSKWVDNQGDEVKNVLALTEVLSL